MKKPFIFIALILFSMSIYSQSTYSGNLAVSDDGYFSDYSESGEFYLGGCNAFPLGTFVNVKLPYSDDAVNVKIVSRIPEDGIFILVDKKAGEKLFLEPEDILPVRIQVIDFIPPPISKSTDLEVDPEPEIKGLTALSIAEETIADDESLVPETVTESDDDILDDSLMLNKETDDSGETISDDVKEDEIVNDKIVTPEEVETEIETEIVKDEEISKPSMDVAKPIEDASIKDSTEVSEKPEIKDEKSIETEPVSAKISASETVTEKEEPKKELKLYEDKLPVESMFTEIPEELEKSAAEPVKKEEVKPAESGRIVKKIFFLEPANKKPPVGGIPDSELIPVTTVEKNRILEDGYYLQVGIYTNSDTVYLDSDKLEALNFPFITVKEEAKPNRERLLVGPVKNDELGVIMLQLKGRGFKDFFRYKKKTDN